MLILFVMYLMLITSHAHTADNVTTLLTQSREREPIQLKEPETPKEFMEQLKRVEARMPQCVNEIDSFQLFGKKHSEKFNGYTASCQYEGLRAICNFMQCVGCPEFHDYFMALAKSPLSNKIEDVFVKIPCFKNIQHKPQIEVHQMFDAYNLLHESTYPVNRLFLAAFVSEKMYRQDVLNVFCNNDIILLKKLLRHGLDVDMSIDIGLADCRSLQVAQLLLMHGADFDKQHKKYDLINHQCSEFGSDNNSSLLALFLPYASFNEDNQYGKKWVNTLIENDRHFSAETFVERMAILLQYGCHYDQEQANRVVTARDIKARTLDQFYYKVCLSQLFKQTEISRKNVVIGLHQRALTGKPFGFKRAPQALK